MPTPRRRRLPTSRENVLKRNARPGAAFSFAKKAAAAVGLAAIPGALPLGLGALAINRFTAAGAAPQPSAIEQARGTFDLQAARDQFAAIGGGPQIPFGTQTARPGGPLGGNFQIPTGLPTTRTRLGGKVGSFDVSRPPFTAQFQGYEPTVEQNFDQYMDELLDNLQTQQALEREAFEQGLDDIARAYAGDIAETQRRIGEAQIAQGDVNTAYDKYRGLIDKYADRARLADADPDAYAKNIDDLQAEALATSAGAFDSAEEAVADTLLLIGADDPDLAKSLAADVREFDAFAKESIEVGLDQEENVMRAGVDLSTKLIDSVESDDVLTSEIARQATQARLTAYLEEMVRQKRALEEAMAEDVRRANEEFQDSYGEEINADTLFDWSFQRWAQDQQFDSQQMLDLRAEFDTWYNGPDQVRTAEDMRKIIQAGIFIDNAQIVALDPRNQALWEDIPGLVKSDGIQPNVQAIAEWLAIYKSASDKLSRGIGSGRIWFQIQDSSQSSGFRQIGLFLPDEGFDDKFNDPDVTNLLHMFDLRRLAIDRADDVANRFQDTLSVNPSTGWVFPVATTTGYSNSFLYKRAGDSPHKGIDIYAPDGTMIVSPVSGTISRVGSSGNPGNRVYVVGPNGVEYVFFHMKYTTALKVGDRVRAGALLGYVGTSGNARGTSPHLHFEMRGTQNQKGKWYNPYDHLQASKGKGGTPSFTTSGTSGRGVSSGAPKASTRRTPRTPRPNDPSRRHIGPT